MDTNNIFVSIDFDGTITDTDITDAIIQRFARPGWEEAERLWEAGRIGSRECLERQFSLIDAPLERLLEYAGTFTIDKEFSSFISCLKRMDIPYAIISDGFEVIIRRILGQAGLKGMPVYANRLTAENGALKAAFPYSSRNCPSGVCKSEVARTLSDGSPVVHIGDGRSDFCVSEDALWVYSKGKLTDFCVDRGIPHVEFNGFADIRMSLEALVARIPARTGLNLLVPASENL